MSLADLTDSEAVVAAIKECDALGREGFLRRYGFMPAKSYVLVYEGGAYDSKAIAGVAYGIQHPQLGHLSASAFSGGEKTVARRLRELGFTVEHRETGHSPGRRRTQGTSPGLGNPSSDTRDGGGSSQRSQTAKQAALHVSSYVNRHGSRKVQVISSMEFMCRVANREPEGRGRPQRIPLRCRPSVVLWLVGPSIQAAALDQVRSWRGAGVDARPLLLDARRSGPGWLVRVQAESAQARDQLENRLLKGAPPPRWEQASVRLHLYQERPASAGARWGGDLLAEPYARIRWPDGTWDKVMP